MADATSPFACSACSSLSICPMTHLTWQGLWTRFV